MSPSSPARGRMAAHAARGVFGAVHRQRVRTSSAGASPSAGGVLLALARRDELGKIVVGDHVHKRRCRLGWRIHRPSLHAHLRPEPRPSASEAALRAVGSSRTSGETGSRPMTVRSRSDDGRRPSCSRTWRNELRDLSSHSADPRRRHVRRYGFLGGRGAVLRPDSLRRWLRPIRSATRRRPTIASLAALLSTTSRGDGRGSATRHSRVVPTSLRNRQARWGASSITARSSLYPRTRRRTGVTGWRLPSGWRKARPRATRTTSRGVAGRIWPAGRAMSSTYRLRTRSSRRVQPARLGTVARKRSYAVDMHRPYGAFHESASDPGRVRYGAAERFEDPTRVGCHAPRRCVA